jgi:hypothetical protein
MVEPQIEEKTCFTAKEYALFEMLKRKQKMIGDVGKNKVIDETSTCELGGNFAALAHSSTSTKHALASKIFTRSLEWIIYSGAS